MVRSRPSLQSPKRHGFDTAAFVGAAVLNRHFGLHRGFDHYGDNLNEKRDAKLLPGVVAELRGDAVTRRALDWLDQRAKPGTESCACKKLLSLDSLLRPALPLRSTGTVWQPFSERQVQW